MNLRFQDFDPRCRLLAVIGATAWIAGTARGELRLLAWYLPLVLFLAALGRVQPLVLLRKSMAAAPFLLLAGGALLLRESLPMAASVVLKGWLAAMLLTVLSVTMTLQELLWALRKLHIPESMSLILTMMSRYIGLLREEYTRLARARDSRTAGALGGRALGIHARQFGTLILRSWDRAERIYSSMVSRGFTGHWPNTLRSEFGTAELGFLAFEVAVLAGLQAGAG